MHRGVPQNDRLINLFLAMGSRPTMSLTSTLGTLLVITKQVEGIHRSILITLPDLKLFRIIRKGAYEIVPVVKMIGVVVIRIIPGQVREFATLVQSAVVRGSFRVGRADESAQV